MTRRWSLAAGALALALAAPGAAFAQDGEPEVEMEPDDPSKPIEEPTEGTDMEITVDEAEKPAEKNDIKLSETRQSWQDIVVVMRKPFLKMNRLELTPSAAVTLNDNMIRHYELNGQASYWLTDVLAVGFEGQLFVKDFLETFDLVARQDRRLPTLNKYNFGAALNFHYVPIYAKFAMFNKRIVHWEAFFTAGVGFTQSEVIPRDPALPGWTNFLITPNVGFTARVFVTKWVTLNLGIRDYIFVDKFENVNRDDTMSLDEAKDDASGKLVNHLVFQAGLSFWFPTSFKYTTFR
jgi:outer membrane beta-barrel protein